MCWRRCKATPRPCGRCCWVGWGLRVTRSFSFDGTAELSNHALLRLVSPISLSLPCPIEAGWKTSGHHGNSAESVATPWKSETLRARLSSGRMTTPRHSGAAVWNFSWVITKTFTWGVFRRRRRVLMMYLDTYSLERVSMATGSLDSTTSRSNLLSVWHCVSDSFRCFEGRGAEREREEQRLVEEIIHVAGLYCLKTRFTSVALWVVFLV